MQRRIARPAQDDEQLAAQAADHATSGPGGALPHADVIQRAFGMHDVSGIRAHTDPAAAEGSRAMGAQAFARGSDVAFDGAPSLHTAAHEAAHVVQQRAGVQLAAGVGRAGDAYERHADSVADLVVQGRSAEALLDEHAAAGGAPATQRAPIQRKVVVMPEQYLGGIGLPDVNQANLAQLKEYLRMAVHSDVTAVAGKLGKDHETTVQMRGLYNGVWRGTRTGADAIADLGALIGLVNDNWDALDMGPNSETRYGAYEEDAWGDMSEMGQKLGSFLGDNVQGYGTVEPSSVTVRRKGKKTGKEPEKHEPLVQIPWDDAKAFLPAALTRLIFDIRYQIEPRARGGQQVIDERTEQEKLNKQKSPSEPGSLRSWHQDSKGFLPANPGQVPEGSRALHEHYTGTSQPGVGSSTKEQQIDAPRGYAEYTGTGAKDDVHNVKIVFDYIQKRVYLCFSHYQYCALFFTNPGTFFNCGTQSKAQAEGRAKTVYETGCDESKRRILPDGAEETDYRLLNPWFEILMQ